jgi:nucleotide-binding universal stress UspA family protein
MTCLVYVDASPRGEWALTMAQGLPAALADPLTLVATIEDLAATPGLLDAARRRLEAAGRRVHALSAAGPAERALVDLASRQSYTLVVVPPAGRRARARRFRGWPP